ASCSFVSHGSEMLVAARGATASASRALRRRSVRLCAPADRALRGEAKSTAPVALCARLSGFVRRQVRISVDDQPLAQPTQPRGLGAAWPAAVERVAASVRKRRAADRTRPLCAAVGGVVNREAELELVSLGIWAGGHRRRPLPV